MGLGSRSIQREPRGRGFAEEAGLIGHGEWNGIVENAAAHLGDVPVF